MKSQGIKKQVKFCMQVSGGRGLQIRNASWRHKFMGLDSQAMMLMEVLELLGFL